uniref:Uncharacterized protein n=1 Tax=Magallana gigas TaxID=29159 RepID=A0A8W8P1Z3_MAGGI
MSGKRKTDYAKVLSVLLDHMARQPSVVVDFEAGLWKSIRETIRNSLTEVGDGLTKTKGRICIVYIIIRWDGLTKFWGWISQNIGNELTWAA